MASPLNMKNRDPWMASWQGNLKVMTYKAQEHI